MSSSDGQRFPVSVKCRIATANPRYFGYVRCAHRRLRLTGKGLTFYSWTSDQFSQYVRCAHRRQRLTGSRVIPTTVRDATYVLDAILYNETELEIIEHTTDTAGYTELVFALFDCLVAFTNTFRMGVKATIRFAWDAILTPNQGHRRPENLPY